MQPGIEEEDLYAVLGVAPSSTLAEIRAAYHAAARATHPDSAPAPSAPARFHAVQRAWGALQSAELRAAYDAARARCAAVRAAAAAAAPVREDVRCDALQPPAGGGGLQHPCRCGAAFALSDEDVAARAELVQCGGCSLFIRVVYGGDAE